MLIAELELLTLENENGLNLVVDFHGLEIANRLKVRDAELKEIKNVACKHTAKNNIVGPLLLMRAKDEKAAILFGSHVFKRTDVFEWLVIMTRSHKQF